MADLNPQSLAAVQSVLAQLPATLMAMAAFIAAAAAAYQSVKTANRTEAIRETVGKVETTTNATHNLINSRFDEWKAETKATALEAVRTALAEGVRLGLRQAALKAEEGRAAFDAGKAEATQTGKDIAIALATPTEPKP